MGMLFAVALLFMNGDAYMLDRGLSASQCAVAVMASPEPPYGARLVCVLLPVTQGAVA